MNNLYKIEDVCLVKGGKRIPEGETLQETPNEHPYIRILDMYQGRILELNDSMMYARDKYISRIKKYTVNEGDVILAIVGNTLGMVSTIGKSLNNANLTENCCKFVDINTDKVLPLFLYYSLISPLNQKKIERFKVGSSQPKLPLYNVGQLLIPNVTVNQQQEIIKILSTIDGKIECNQKICSQLEAMAKTLYDYWFVQFDFPDENGRPYRTSGGEMVWNEQLKREIPKGWDIGTLSEHITGDKNGDWGKEHKQGNYTKKVTCIRGADFPAISSNKQLEAPTRYILGKNASKHLCPGDIIVEISGGSPTQSTGRICYINEITMQRFQNDIITSNFCRAFTTCEHYEQYWFYLLWKSLYDAGVLFGYEGKTTGIKNLLFDMLCTQYKIISPNIYNTIGTCLKGIICQ